MLNNKTIDALLEELDKHQKIIVKLESGLFRLKNAQAVSKNSDNETIDWLVDNATQILDKFLEKEKKAVRLINNILVEEYDQLDIESISI